LARALRVDKLTLSALEGTLWAYRSKEGAFSEIPHLRMITLKEGELKRRAQRLKRLIQKEAPHVEAKVLRESSRIGGGSFPLAELPTWAVALKAKGLSAQELEARLRSGDPPVVARVSEDHVILDPRTIPEEEIFIVAQAVGKAIRGDEED